MDARPRLLSASRHAIQSCAVLALACLLGCSSGSAPQDTLNTQENTQKNTQEDTPELTRCVGPRPQICTREYRPVCGESLDGSTKTFGNACDACSHQEVVGHRPGECVG